MKKNKKFIIFVVGCSLMTVSMVVFARSYDVVKMTIVNDTKTVPILIETPQAVCGDASKFANQIVPFGDHFTAVFSIQKDSEVGRCHEHNSIVYMNFYDYSNNEKGELIGQYEYYNGTVLPWVGQENIWQVFTYSADWVMLHSDTANNQPQSARPVPATINIESPIGK